MRGERSRTSGLIVDEISPEAADEACTRWHYSATTSRGVAVVHGVWEADVWRGVLMYGHGSNRNMARPFGVTVHEAAELTRICLERHQVPLTAILSRSVRLLHRHNPGLRVLVSYADPAEGHHGGVYQAAGWTYTGTATSQGGYEPAHVVRGRLYHPRAVRKKGWKNNTLWLRENVDPDAQPVAHEPKHRYVFPLDRAMRRKVAKLAKPYPKTDRRPSYKPCGRCAPRLDVPHEERVPAPPVDPPVEGQLAFTVD